MPRSFSSARARFAATAATVFALIALGGVTATPAYAYGDLYLTVNDDSTGGAYADKYFTLTPVGPGFPISIDTDSSGTRAIGTMQSGDYNFTPDDPAYVLTSTPITIQDAANHITVHVDKYRVAGSVPTGMGSGNTTAVIQQDTGAGFVSQPGTQSISAGDDSFSLTVPNGPGTYRILFQPSAASVYADSYSASFTVDGTLATTAVGAVAFDTAPTLSGHIDSFTYGGPIVGAVAHALSGGVVVATGTTDVDGDFRIKLPAGDGVYTVYAEATNYVRHYYNFVVQESHATPVAVNATDGYERTGLNFALEIDTSNLSGNVISSDGAYAVDMTLYMYDTNTARWSSFPYYTSYEPSSTFSYGQLPLADYRMAFSHPTTGVVLPANGACYLDFSSVLVTNVVFTDVLVDPSAGVGECDDPVWLDAGDAAITGTVENIDDVDHGLIAQLMGPGPYGSIVVLDSATVDPATGDYSLAGLRWADDYFIRFLTDDRDAVLDTLLGAGGYSEWAADSDVESNFHGSHRFWADPADSATLEGHDVTLAAAAAIDGSATYNGDPVEATVVARDVDDGYHAYEIALDADGEFEAKLPAGRTFVLSVETPDDEYVEQFWENKSSLATATELGPLASGHAGTFDFELERTPAELWVWTSDAVEDDEVYVQLYYKDAMGDWQPLELEYTDGGEANFFRNLQGDEVGLVPGDFRVRFRTLGGTWLEATDYGFGQDSSDGDYTEGTAPSCFIDFLGLESGVPSFIQAEFDVNAQTTVCGPEPLPLAHPTVYGNTVALDWSSTLSRFDVDFRLYKEVAGSFGPTPLDSNLYGDFFYYSFLADGTYRVAFSDRMTGAWLPWQSTSVNGTPLSAAATASDCYLEFTVVAGSGDVEYSDVVIDPTQGDHYCDQPPWAVAATGEFSGTVTNISSFTGPVVAYFYAADGDTLLDFSPVDPATGAYSLTGVSTTDDYFVLFEAPEDDPYLDTLLGDDGGDQYLAWADDLDAWDAVSAGFAIPLDANTDYAGNDVALLEAAVLTGTVRADGVPIPNLCVQAENPVPPVAYLCSGTDADGEYRIKVAPGTDWVLSVAGAYGYDDQYWEGTDSFADAELVSPATVGIHSGYDFDLTGWPPYLLGILFEEGVGPVDDIVVHLYKPVTGGYQEVATTTTDSSSMIINFEFDDSIVTESSYRLRFEAPGGGWLLMSQLIITDATDFFSGTPTAISSCFVDIPTLKPGPETIVGVGFDADAQTGACTAEPSVVPGTNGGGGTVPPPLVTPKPKPRMFAAATPATTTTPVETPTPTPTPSAEAEEEPTDEPSASPRPDPEEASAAPDLTWLWIIIAAIVVLLLGCAAFVIFRRR